MSSIDDIRARAEATGDQEAIRELAREMIRGGEHVDAVTILVDIGDMETAFKVAESVSDGFFDLTITEANYIEIAREYADLLSLIFINAESGNHRAQAFGELYSLLDKAQRTFLRWRRTGREAEATQLAETVEYIRALLPYDFEKRLERDIENEFQGGLWDALVRGPDFWQGNVDGIIQLAMKWDEGAEESQDVYLRFDFINYRSQDVLVTWMFWEEPPALLRVDLGRPAPSRSAGDAGPGATQPGVETWGDGERWLDELTFESVAEVLKEMHDDWDDHYADGYEEDDWDVLRTT